MIKKSFNQSLPATDSSLSRRKFLRNSMFSLIALSNHQLFANEFPDGSVQNPKTGRSNAFCLIVKGRARGVIYLAPDATETAMYAAKELQDHLELATGVRVPIEGIMPQDRKLPVVFVGPSKETEIRGVSSCSLEPEEYIIKTGDNWLALLGDDTEGLPFQNLIGEREVKRSGTLQAVYIWLADTLGVRWFMPGELGTVVTPTRRLDVAAVNIASKPALQVRQQLLVLQSDDTNRTQTKPGSDLSRWYLRAHFGRSLNTYLMCDPMELHAG